MVCSNPPTHASKSLIIFRKMPYALDAGGIYANRNTIPNEPGSPFYPSGLRLGTPLVTTRGMKEAEMAQIGRWIAQVVAYVKEATLPGEPQARRAFVKSFKQQIDQDPYLLALREQVKSLAVQFPLFAA
jgi:glycine hydroxymethyltransferase